MIRSKRRALTIFTCCLMVASAAGAAKIARADNPDMHGTAVAGEETLGTVDFGVSCAEPTQPAFDRALGFLHHMMYEQARSGFEQVAETDPECAMAHWGVATTLFQPLWATRPTSDDLMWGWTGIQNAKALDPATERERHLVAATEAFFREPETAEWWTRIERWAEAMEMAYRAAPEDPDTATLYALSRLALVSVAENRGALQDEAETVLRGVHDRMPAHPGAIHYTIHANDAAGRADRSLDIVKSYGEIAPEVAHALHMPSHIFVRLGEWPAVIDWNLRSADAALQHPAGDAVSTFGERGTLNCASSTIGQGYIGPSAEPHLKQGAVMWQIESGEGRFKGAQGLITSNFIISDAGEVIDHHTGGIFVM